MLWVKGMLGFRGALSAWELKGLHCTRRLISTPGDDLNASMSGPRTLVRDFFCSGQVTMKVCILGSPGRESSSLGPLLGNYCTCATSKKRQKRATPFVIMPKYLKVTIDTQEDSSSVRARRYRRPLLQTEQPPTATCHNLLLCHVLQGFRGFEEVPQG